jgi:hypothetical protein
LAKAQKGGAMGHDLSIHVQTDSHKTNGGIVALSDQKAPAAPPATPNETEAKQLDFLLDQRQKLAQIYDDRRKDADSNATSVLAAAVALALLGVGATQTQLEAHKVFAAIAICAGVLSATLAMLARSAAGLRPRAGTRGDLPKRSWRLMRAVLYGWRPRSTERGETDAISLLSHESEAFRDAYSKLEENHVPSVDRRRAAALDLYRARARDLHYEARAKERTVAVAGLIYVVAVACLAIVGLVSICT